MIIKHKEVIHPYETRKSFYNEKFKLIDWFLKFLKLEPHTIYNMGHFIDFTSKYKSLNKVISIGVDPFKELLVYNNFEIDFMDVYDIDTEIVSKGNKYFKKNDFKISYINSNVLNDEIKGNYDTLLLFQMDYIFSDEELLLVLNKIKKTGVKKCFVMTPSIFNLNKSFLPFVFVDYFSLIYMKFFRKQPDSKNYYFNYRRTKQHLIRVFKKSMYFLEDEKVFMNNNGSYNLFHFRT